MYAWFVEYKKAIEEFQKNGPKVIYSIGGYNHPSEPFSQMVSSEESRKKFIDDIKTFLREYKFDGLDIYWYSPVYWSGNTDLHYEDKPNFQALMDELKVRRSKIYFFVRHNSEWSQYNKTFYKTKIQTCFEG